MFNEEILAEVLRVFNDDFREFESVCNPIRVRISNSEKTVGVVIGKEMPEFEEKSNGIFVLLKGDGDDSYLFPLPGVSTYELSQVRACFEIETVEGPDKREAVSLKRVEKIAICSKRSNGWVLKKKGRAIFHN